MACAQKEVAPAYPAYNSKQTAYKAISNGAHLRVMHGQFLRIKADGNEHNSVKVTRMLTYAYQLLHRAKINVRQRECP